MVLASQPLVRILQEIEAEQRALTTLLVRLTPDQLTDWSGGWSPVDTLNHITAWKENALRVARSQAAPDAPALDPEARVGQILGLDTDRFNDESTRRHQAKSLAEALDWSNDVHRALLDALVRLPVDRVLGGSGPYGARLWYARPGIGHVREHREALAARLAGRA
jgi:hypothetical protein